MKQPPRDHDPALDLDLPGPAAWDNVGRPRKGRRRPGEIRAPAPRGSRQPRPRGPLTRLFIALVWLSLGGAVFGLAALFCLYAYFSQDLPSTAGLRNYAPPTVTYFYADDGRVVGEYSHERRFVLPLEDIPPWSVRPSSPWRTPPSTSTRESTSGA